MSDKFILSDDEIIQKTQRVRNDILDAITASGVPTDSKSVRVLIELTNSMDASALANKRLKLDDKHGDENRQAAATIIKMFEQLGSVRRLADDTIESTCTAIDDKMSLQEGDLPAITLVPGETDTNPPSMDYDSFMSMIEGDDGPDIFEVE